jgi:hypothetical protein
MHIDKTRRHDVAAGVDFTPGLACQLWCDRRDTSVTDADISHDARRPRAVDDGTVFDQ